MVHRTRNYLRTHSAATRCEQRPQVLCNAAMDQPATRSDSAKSYSHAHVTFDDGIELECGTNLRRHTVAYRTYGTLNSDRSNAVLVCHALTLDQYVAEEHPITGKPGWWDTVVGPELPIDTDRFFVICPNVLGGCMGSTGPLSHRELPDGTVIDEPWGTEFPPVTIGDMVRAQKRLIEHLGIDRLFAVIGGSMGGMQVLQWAASYPQAVFAALPIATAAYHSAQNIAFQEVGRQAIFADPDWQSGQYLALRPHTRPRLGRRPDVRPHHLFVRGGADPEIRPPAAKRPEGQHRGDQLVR